MNYIYHLYKYLCIMWIYIHVYIRILWILHIYHTSYVYYILQKYIQVHVALTYLFYVYIYIYIYIYIWSYHAVSMDLPDPPSGGERGSGRSVSIVPRSPEVFKATSCIGTELLYMGSSWSSNFCSSMWRDPREYIAYEFVLTSPAVSHMSGSFNLDSFREGVSVAVELLLCRVLALEFIQCSPLHFYVIAVKLFLHTFI